MNRISFILLQIVLFLDGISYSFAQEYPFPEKGDFKDHKPGAFVGREDSLKGYRVTHLSLKSLIFYNLQNT